MSDSRVALVTGCGKRDGVGNGLAHRLAADGFNVVVTDRAMDGVPNVGDPVSGSNDGLNVLVAELEQAGVRALGLTGDIGNHEDVQRMFAAVDEAFGRLDVLVNNAAAPQGADRADIEDVPLEAWHEQLRVTLTGTFHMCHAAVPRMRANNYGRIVNVSSMAGLSAAPRSTAYSAAKAGILGLTRALSADVAGDGITVNAVTPGLVGTSRAMLTRRGADRDAHLEQMASRVAVGKVGMPEDIANVVAFFADERTSHITGQVLSVDGGGFRMGPPPSDKK